MNRVQRPSSMLPRQHSRQTKVLVAALVVAALVASPSSAAARDSTLHDLQPFIGRVVVVETNDRPQVIARLVSADESAIVATVGGVETTFRNTEVRSIAADQDSMKIGLFIGASVGVAAAILGAQGSSCSDCPGKVAAGAAVSIGAFTALGALIGKHHHRRVTIYRGR
jgi:hypothetical protein